jgi:hypothetical protein
MSDLLSKVKKTDGRALDIFEHIESEKSLGNDEEETSRCQSDDSIENRLKDSFNKKEEPTTHTCSKHVHFDEKLTVA